MHDRTLQEIADRVHDVPIGYLLLTAAAEEHEGRLEMALILTELALHRLWQ